MKSLPSAITTGRTNKYPVFYLFYFETDNNPSFKNFWTNNADIILKDVSGNVLTKDYTMIAKDGFGTIEKEVDIDNLGNIATISNVNIKILNTTSFIEGLSEGDLDNVDCSIWMGYIPPENTIKWDKDPYHASNEMLQIFKGRIYDYPHSYLESTLKCRDISYDSIEKEIPVKYVQNNNASDTDNYFPNANNEALGKKQGLLYTANGLIIPGLNINKALQEYEVCGHDTHTGGNNNLYVFIDEIKDLIYIETTPQVLKHKSGLIYLDITSITRNANKTSILANGNVIGSTGKSGEKFLLMTKGRNWNEPNSPSNATDFDLTNYTRITQNKSAYLTLNNAQDLGVFFGINLFQFIISIEAIQGTLTAYWFDKDGNKSASLGTTILTGEIPFTINSANLNWENFGLGEFGFDVSNGAGDYVDLKYIYISRELFIIKRLFKPATYIEKKYKAKGGKYGTKSRTRQELVSSEVPGFNKIENIFYDGYGRLFGSWIEESFTCTITIASPAVITATGHKFKEGQPIKFSTTGALPTGITAGNLYYVRNAKMNTFNISSTRTGALINTSGTQSGTHTVKRNIGKTSSNAIHNPIYIIESILRDELNYTSSEINITSFDRIGNTTDGYRGQGTYTGFDTAGNWLCDIFINSPIKLSELILNICEQFGLIFFINDYGEFTFKAIYDDSPSLTITNADCGKDNEPEIEKVGLDELFSKFELKYNFSYSLEDFLNTYILNKDNKSADITTTRNTAPSSFLTLLTKTEENYRISKLFSYSANLIKDDSTAQYYIKFIADWLSYPKRKFIHKTEDFNLLEYELGDTGKINHELLPTGIKNIQTFILTKILHDTTDDSLKLQWTEIPRQNRS